MGLLVAVVLFTWLLSKAVSDAKLDHAYARQGMVSPRLAVKYGSRDKAAAMVAKYGFFDHLRDAWRDYWPRRTAALVAARNVRAVDGTSRVRLRDRLAAGRNAITDRFATQPSAPAGGHAEPDQPRPDSGPAPSEADEPEPAAAAEPDQAPSPAAAPEPVGGDPTDPADVAADPGPDITPEPDAPAPAPASGGTAMTSGEAVNYETAIATIDGMIADVQVQIEAAHCALGKMAEAKTAVDALQQTYQPTAEAAQTKLDHEAALNLDGTTLGHAGATADALPPNAVDGLYERVEQVEQMTNERLVQAETALASLEAERAHLVATYSDAHTTVSGNLGGDSRFLDSGGPGQTPAQSLPRTWSPS